MDKDNKVVVITGGNSGLGKATAEILIKEGKQVVILGKNIEEVEKVSKELGADGIVCDVTDTGQIKNAFSQIIDKYKKVDCLINCAGVWIKGGPIEETNPEEIKNTFMVNSVGTILVANVVASQLKKQKFGRIINISSHAGISAKAERSVYNASKWAVTGFTKSLQLEMAPFGVNVVGFYPGFIHTDFFEKTGDRKDYDRAMPVEKPAKLLAYLVDVDNDLGVNAIEVQSLKEIK